MQKIRRISICDSGEFSDCTGQRSSPRVESVLREAVLRGEVLLSGMSYMESPPGKRLEGEGKKIYQLRNQDRWAIERDRVCKTSTTFQLQPKNIEHTISMSDVVFILMRPSHRRSELITRVVEAGKLAIVFPPYFSCRVELDRLRDALSESESEDRVILWLPYRFSVSAKAIRRRLQKSEIAAMELTVASGPYVTHLLAHEYAVPFLDALRVTGGRFVEKIEITRTRVNGLPVFHMKSIHWSSSNYVLGSSLITTAGGTLQNTEAGRLKVFSTKMGGQSIETTGTFTGYVHRRNSFHEFTEISHDQGASELTGYSVLLKYCLDKKKWDEEDKYVKPTMASFSQMQRVLDAFGSFGSFGDDEAFIEGPETKEIIF